MQTGETGSGDVAAQGEELRRPHDKAAGALLDISLQEASVRSEALDALYGNVSPAMQGKSELELKNLAQPTLDQFNELVSLGRIESRSIITGTYGH